MCVINSTAKVNQPNWPGALQSRGWGLPRKTMGSQTHSPGLLLRQALTLTGLPQGEYVRAKGRVSRATDTQHSKVKATDGGLSTPLRGRPQSQCEGSDAAWEEGRPLPALSLLLFCGGSLS